MTTLSMPLRKSARWERFRRGTDRVDLSGSLQTARGLRRYRDHDRLGRGARMRIRSPVLPLLVGLATAIVLVALSMNATATDNAGQRAPQAAPTATAAPSPS